MSGYKSCRHCLDATENTQANDNLSAIRAAGWHQGNPIGPDHSFIVDFVKEMKASGAE